MEKSDLSGSGNGSTRPVSLIATFFAVTLIVFASALHAEPEFVQSQANFEKATRNRSTVTYIVFVTVVNDITGEAQTECMSAHLLLGAIHREYNLDYDASSIEKAIQIALANSSRIFHFSKQAAIDNIPSKRQIKDYQEACPLVKQGKSTYFTDHGWQVRVDPQTTD
jgi:hypothetical protein